MQASASWLGAEPPQAYRAAAISAAATMSDNLMTLSRHLVSGSGQRTDQQLGSVPPCETQLLLVTPPFSWLSWEFTLLI